MRNLISKAWRFNPNTHTTRFELHAVFTDNTTSVYVFRKVGTSWEPTGKPHDDRLVITLPGNEHSSFIVRTYDGDSYRSSWHRFMQSRSNPWNEVGPEYTDDSRGLKTLLSKANLNGTYRMIPIGYSSGDWSYIFTTQN